MKILGIETSCDETAVSIIEADGGFERPRFAILANLVASQIPIHEAWGGVVPSLAKREHEKTLPPMVARAFETARLSPADIDAIAVTRGPGLEPALWVGITHAERYAKEWAKPLVGVNHLGGHIAAALLRSAADTKTPELHFPAIVLLISGGHTELILMREWLAYEKLGSTRDDAVGEAFDKVARMLGFPYPGGPHVSRAAAEGGPSDINLPRPMIHSGNYDFSYSGLKTAVLYHLREHPEPNEKERANLCFEFERAATDVLVAKTSRALEAYDPASLIIGGGVVANTHIRAEFTRLVDERFPDIALHIPELKFTGDNAAMIAAAAYFHTLRGEYAREPLEANGNLSIA